MSRGINLDYCKNVQLLPLTMAIIRLNTMRCSHRNKLKGLSFTDHRNRYPVPYSVLAVNQYIECKTPASLSEF